MSRDEVNTNILNLTFKDGTVDVQQPACGLTAAHTDVPQLRTVIDNKIMKLAYLTIARLSSQSFVLIIAINRTWRWISSSRYLTTMMVIR